MSHLAIEYVKAGLALVQIRQGSKAPLIKAWQQAEHAITTEEQAAALPDDAALGLAHRWCGTCALDVDDIKAATLWLATRGLDLDDLQLAFDAVLDVSGKEGHTKLIYRLPEGIKWLKTVKPTASGLELRNATADGLTVQDVIAPSIHPDTKKPYSWKGDWRKIPEIPPRLLDIWQQLLKPKPKPNGTNGSHPPVRALDELKDALEYISADEYETWIKVGMGLHDNFHGETTGLELWDSWSQSSGKYEAGECARRWESFTPGGVSAAAIFGLAKDAGAPVAEMARKRNVRPVKPKVEPVNTKSRALTIVEPDGSQRPPIQAPITYQSLGLPMGKNGPIPDMYCALKVLRGVERWAGRIHYDTFLLKILVDNHALTEQDDLEFLEYLQGELGISKFPPQAAEMAIRSYAFANKRDCIQEWLNALPPWDGIPRIASIFPDLFGAPRNEYSEAVGTNFMRSMVARILKPGCMVKHMVILEGAQDAGKSKMLRLLVGMDWFTEQHERAESKDFYMVFEGKVLIEIGELDAFSKSEVTRIKQVVSCECDRYRSPYGRSAEDHPRRSILVGTTNKDDYLRDDTGGVRFWPIRCTDLNFDGILEQREQLFAEARHDILAGKKWWIMPESTKAEQDERYAADPWCDKVAELINGRKSVNIVYLLTTYFDYAVKDIRRVEQDRIASILRHLGWKNTVTYIDGKTARVWIKK